MSDRAQEKLLELLYRVLRPLVHLLIESGIGHREFAEVAKRAYVDVASKNYGIRGRDTNISRVAVMTGLTRKEVKRLRDESTGKESLAQVKQLPAGRVLQFWHTDEDFLDSAGNPLTLNFSEDEPSFYQLTRKYAGDIPAGALRTELKRAGAIHEDEEGSLEPLRREFRVLDPEAQFEWSLGRTIYGAMANSKYNYFERRAQGTKKFALWPSRLVEAARVGIDDVAKVKEIVSKQSMEFCESLDDAMEPYSENSTAVDSTMIRVAVVYFEDS
ncbi:MAG: DUF6502 family protein [Pseudomonadota bacterium]